MTVDQALNRGYNLMICAFLFASGLAFGSVVINEADLTDKVDDAWLLVTGVMALVWYLTGENRFKRSIVPIAIVVLAVIGQIVGILLEFSDKNAFGDNIGGAIIFTQVLVLAIYQYLRRHKVEASRPPA